MKTSELAKKTLETLKEFGWAKGKLGNCREGMCILGAAYYAAHGKEPVGQLTSYDVCDAIPELVSEMAEYLDPANLMGKQSAVIVWNDDIERKFGDVAKLLELVANE